MHYLLVTWDGSGTVPIDFGIARRLVARGHTVTALGDPTLADEAASSGVELVTWREAPHRRSTALEDDVIQDWEVRHNPFKLLSRLCDRLITGPAAAFAQETAQELARRPADVVVVDAALLGPLVATEALGVPTVAVCPGIYVLPADGMPPFGLGLRPARTALGRTRDRSLNALVRRAWRTGLPPLNEARARWDLPPLQDPWDQLRSAHSMVIPTARAFDFPAAVPQWATYVGPILDDPAWAAEAAAGVPAEAAAGSSPLDPPLVVVGLSGSHIPGQDELLRRIAAALGSLPVRGLVCTGPTVDPAAIPAPDNVAVVRAAPHAEVFGQAAVVVTHGGHGTMLKALAHDRPVLCLPGFRDQKDNARRLTERGAGLKLSPSASPARIAAALRRLLDEPAFGIAAARLGAGIRAEVESSPLVALLEAPARRSEVT